MYKYKICRVKNKGNAIIYVIFIGILLIAISLIMLKFQIEKNSLLYDRINSFNNNSDIQNVKFNREAALSKLYQNLKENKKLNDKSKIIEYLKDDYTEESENSKFSSDFKLWYDSEKEILIMEYPNDTSTNYREYYDINLKDDKVRFMLLGKEILEK